MVESNGRLVRACATTVVDGMQIATKSDKASAAQVEAFDRILSNHLLYCTVCDNNNGNCTVYNTTKLLNAILLVPSHQSFNRRTSVFRYVGAGHLQPSSSIP
jgi:predicted molibdopterin-dependent oxidoreductase YjgC